MKIYLSKYLKYHGIYRNINYSIIQCPERNEGHHAWCIYVNICERQVPPEIFARIWLKPDVDYTISEHGYVMYPYMESLLSEADWHGGITYYKKHGEVPGHRVIEGGCDYSHFFDQKAGYPYTLESVNKDAQKCIDSLINLLQIKQ